MVQEGDLPPGRQVVLSLTLLQCYYCRWVGTALEEQWVVAAALLQSLLQSVEWLGSSASLIHSD